MKRFGSSSGFSEALAHYACVSRAVPPLVRNLVGTRSNSHLDNNGFTVLKLGNMSYRVVLKCSDMRSVPTFAPASVSASDSA